MKVVNFTGDKKDLDGIVETIRFVLFTQTYELSVFEMLGILEMVKEEVLMQAVSE